MGKRANMKGLATRVVQHTRHAASVNHRNNALDQLSEWTSDGGDRVVKYEHNRAGALLSKDDSSSPLVSAREDDDHRSARSDWRSARTGQTWTAYRLPCGGRNCRDCRSSARHSQVLARSSLVTAHLGVGTERAGTGTVPARVLQCPILRTRQP